MPEYNAQGFFYTVQQYNRKQYTYFKMFNISNG